MNTQDYRIAPGGEGPQASTWKDKPHRLIYDLCSEIEILQNKLSHAELIVEMWKTLMQGNATYPKLLTHKGKHEDRKILIADPNSVGSAWLAMFRALDEWDGCYNLLYGDEVAAYAGAKNGCVRHAKWLLEIRSSYEYEEVTIESIYTPINMKERLDA